MPVRNEADTLERSCTTLVRYLRDQSPVAWRITIADRASADGSWAAATGLAHRHPEVVAVRLPHRGRGRALRAVWKASDAPIMVCIDRSTDLPALVPLLGPLLAAQVELTVGSRPRTDTGVPRGVPRALLVRAYDRLLDALLHTGSRVAPRGLIALRTEAATVLLPLVRSDGWFFDAELMVRAGRIGLRIAEVPVDRVETDSLGDSLAALMEMLRELWRLAWAPRARVGPLPGRGFLT
jgi:hypothetical protein